MSYRGQTYGIPCNTGGINASKNIDLISPVGMIPASTRNLNIHEGGRGKRGGTAKVTAEIDSGVRLYGLYDYLKPAGTQYIVFATSTKIWKNATTTIKTGWGANKHVNFSMFDGELYACNGNDAPGKWDGTTWTNLSDIPSDWSGTSFPKYMITHGRGESERNWAFGCSTTPYMVYISPTGDGDDFSDANVTTISIDTRDGFGIVGGVDYTDKLILFGRQQAFIVDDADTDTTNWGYSSVNWQGGVAHQRLITKTPNDVVCMSEDGEIYSVVAAESYGDYKQASLTRPSFIHNWIKDNVRLAYIDNFHSVYDPILRAIKFFIVRTGQTEVDTALIYFLDKGPQEGWMIHDNQSVDSGYSASCSALIRVGAGDYQIYTGDYDGFIWKLEQTTKSDDSNAYTAGFKTPPINCEDARKTKMFKRGWLHVDPQGTETINIKVYVDGTRLETPDGVWADATAYTVGKIVTNDGVIYECTVAHTSAQANDEPGTGTNWDDYWTQHKFSITVASGTTEYPFKIGAKGKKVQFEFYNEIAAEDFFISQVLFDFKTLGAKPS